MRLMKNSIALLLGNGLSRVIEYLLIFILVRLLSDDDYVLYRQYILILATFLPFIIGGTAITFGYYNAKCNTQEKAYVFFNTFIILLIQGAFGFLIFFLLKNLISDYYGNPNIQKIAIYVSFILFFQTIYSFYSFYLIEKNKAKKLVIINVIYAAIKFSIIIILTINNISMENIIFGLVFLNCAYAIFSVADAMIQNKNYKHNFKPNVKPYIIYSSKVYISQVSYALTETIDKNIVSNTMSNFSYAVYSNGAFANPLTPLLLSSINSVMYPEYTKLVDQGHKLEVIELWKKTISISAMILIPLAFALIVFAKPIVILLFTDKYSASVPYFIIYQLSVIFGLTYFGTLYNVVNSTLKYVYRVVSTLVITIFLLYFLSLTKNMLYIAFGALLMKAIAFVLNIQGISKIYKINFFHSYPFRNQIIIILCCTLISLGFYTVNYFIHTTNTFQFIQLFIMLIIEYGIIALIFFNRIKEYVNLFRKDM